jgi:hypothetical protein
MAAALAGRRFLMRGEGDVNPTLVAVALVVLHNAEGGEIFINPTQIAVLHPTRESSGKAGSKNTLVVGGVNCVVSLSNGKFFSVIEPCDVVRKMMEDAR